MKTVSVLLPGFSQVARTFLCLLAPVLFAPAVFGQCAAALEDGGDDGTNVYGWTTVTDHYTDSTDPCFMHSISFVHSYTTRVTITSPSLRQYSITTGSSQCGGCGVGFSRADGSLPIAGEFDAFTISREDDINCSIAGLFFVSTLNFQRTPSQHTYPGQPLPNCRVSQIFDAVTRRGIPHRAQDVRSTNDIQWGQPVQAVEGGTIRLIVTGQPPAPWPACQTTSPAPQPNSVKIQGSDGSVTYYGHMTIAAGLAVGSTVTQGQVIGVLDSSGCQNAPHTHMSRRQGGLTGPIVNFTLPCVNSQFDLINDCCDEEEDP